MVIDFVSVFRKELFLWKNKFKIGKYCKYDKSLKMYQIYPKSSYRFIKQLDRWITLEVWS